ncbi:MAG TPA: rRNA maturation RNase YbeY [Verrucomicrobiae bacterium]|nr:rRNA maturation RNase YbeY [Verrucomicrobiae bacterium]
MTIFVRNLQRRFRVDRLLLCKVAQKVLQQVDAPEDTTIGIILVNDQQIAGLNEKFHRTSGPTDILTFHFPELVGGELTISIEQVVANARRFRTTPARELTRYVVHGVLHLHGYDDRTPRQRTRMRDAERRLLNRIAQSVHLTHLVRQ